MINIYCDESCHLPYDQSDVMILGALSCQESEKQRISQDIRAIKSKYGINSKVELKWTKVSKTKIELYKELIDYFFSNEHLKFRGLVATNKSKLNHKVFNDDDFNLWYYKMYYLLLDRYCQPYEQYRIFIDIKDTNGGPRLKKLHEVLCNNKYDFKQDIIMDIKQINSNRSDFMQLADIIIGALGFYHRGLYRASNSSIYKKELVEHLIGHIGEQNIVKGCSVQETKCNIFIWHPREADK